MNAEIERKKEMFFTASMVPKQVQGEQPKESVKQQAGIKVVEDRDERTRLNMEVMSGKKFLEMRKESMMREGAVARAISTMFTADDTCTLYNAVPPPDQADKKTADKKVADEKKQAEKANKFGKTRAAKKDGKGL